MAKFFQSFDEEKQESQSKTKEIVKRFQEKVSKRDLKYKELKEKISEVKNSAKNFEKNFKKFMNDLKKYVSYFENGEIPEFLTEFLEDDRIKSSKPMLALSAEFSKNFSKPIETIALSKKSSKKDENTLDSILKLENDREKETDLLEFLERDLSSTLKSEVYIALFSIYSRMKNSSKMIEFIKLMDLSLDNHYMKNFLNNLDVYLGKISSIADDKQQFLDLLIYLENSNFRFDHSIVEKRRLEMDFFAFARCPKNTHPLFSLLYFIRQNEWNNALGYFNLNENIFDSSKSSTLVLIEFGRLAAQNQEFQLAFDCLFKCSKSEFYPTIKIDIFSLCVILNEKLIGHEFFMEFIEEFKKFEANSLCLPSGDPTTEVCRAFYYLNSLDFKSSAAIIENISLYKPIDQLKKQAIRLYDNIHVNN